MVDRWAGGVREPAAVRVRGVMGGRVAAALGGGGGRVVASRAGAGVTFVVRGCGGGRGGGGGGRSARAARTDRGRGGVPRERSERTRWAAARAHASPARLFGGALLAQLVCTHLPSL